jgi:hypothetical protein
VEGGGLIVITKRLPFADYQALPGVNFSTLKEMDVSPLHYQRAVSLGGREVTDAMRLGSIAHSLILTPGHDELAIWSGTRRGKVWDEFCSANAGKLIVKEDEVRPLLEMRRAVYAHDPANALLADGDPEVVLQWVDAETGLACKARVDWLRPRGRLVELKTSKAAHPRAFFRSFAAFKYHAQLAFYLDGLAACGIESTEPPAVIAVESGPPFDVCVYRVPNDAIEAGRRKVLGWLRAVAECAAAGKWPGAGGDAAVDLVLPEWATEDGEDVNLDALGEVA